MNQKKKDIYYFLKKAYKNNKQNENLLSIAEHIVSEVKEHLKQISSQMPGYDIHDEEHSENVIKIMGEILADKLKSLSFYELILLYLAAYLHDSGMALPAWEYEALKSVEGCDECHEKGLKFFIGNDFKPIQYYDTVKKLVEKAKKELFNYDPKDYIFIEDSERERVENICKLILDYESFRSEKQPQLKEAKDFSEKKYLELSEDIRSEFIRDKHHKKAASNIKNLKNKFKTEIEDAIGKPFAKRFLEDLEKICQAHGENLDFIKKQKDFPVERNDWDNQKNNIQFLAEILRLGDIIDFSSDRAPLSLYAEKQISNMESRRNWEVKNKCGVKYSIDKGQISFYAVCDVNEPELYFFLADYIKYIETEISNFNLLKESWETLQKNNAYNILLTREVSADIVTEGFDPDLDMKFTMDQSKILDLLGGVQLYEDKFACLREVYQNALDTSKCLLAYNKSRNFSENINIEFGIGEEELEGRRRKFIYCRDQGLGMNKEIIKKYLLHIGHSYYNSGDFYRDNAQWNSDVKPTSQFGIGILSCYMIADKIGITTKYYKGKQDEEPIISCVLSGISERFYYKNPSRSDKNKIGEHGTIIKLYLKDEYAENIKSDFIPKMPFFLIMKTDPEYYKEDKDDKDTELLGDLEKVKNNLFYILFQYIGIQHSEIPVVIMTPEEKTEPLYQYNNIFEYKKYEEVSEDEINKLSLFCNYRRSIRNIDNITNYMVETKTDNITLYTLLTLPKKGVSADNVYGSSLNFNGYKGVIDKCLCDGITVDFSKDLCKYLNFDQDVLDFSFVNFHGKKRPVLSVDRSKFVNFPKFSDNELDQLKKEFVSNIVNKIIDHMHEENISSKDPEFLLMYESIVSRYNINFTSKLLQETISVLKEDVFFYDEGLKNLKVNDILSQKSIDIENINFLEYQDISKLLILGKCRDANLINISNDDLHIEGDFKDSKFKIMLSDRYIYRADDWNGKYEEYDFVTSLWPIINKNLYDSLEFLGSYNISDHCKNISFSPDELLDIRDNNKLNIEINADSLNPNGTGDIDFLYDKYFFKYLLNRMDFGNKNAKNIICSHTLFAYISPRNLTSNELTNSTYSKGWSLYLFQAMGKYIIVPGLISREEIEKKIPESFKETDITYIDTNGKIVIQGKKSPNQ